jgi:GTPase SAR1 family protein
LRFRPSFFRSLFLGDTGAGKTSLLDMLHTKLAAKKLRNPPPSLQPRAFDLSADGEPFTAIDQPGADNLRVWWADALKEADGVVFACDSSTESLKMQLQLLRVTLAGLVPLLNAARVPLLLLATKQDVQGSLSAGRLAAQLALVNGDPPLRVPFAARGCTLLAGPEALQEALAWVVQHARPCTRVRKPPPPPPPPPPEPEEEEEEEEEEAPPPPRKGAKKKSKGSAQQATAHGYNIRSTV